MRSASQFSRCNQTSGMWHDSFLACVKAGSRQRLVLTKLQLRPVYDVDLSPWQRHKVRIFVLIETRLPTCRKPQLLLEHRS